MVRKKRKVSTSKTNKKLTKEETALTKARSKLNLRQIKFCELYASSKEFFGNGVESYIKAYNPDKSKKNWYNSARATSSEILTNLNVCNYINSILTLNGFNDQFADKQLLFCMTQHKDLNVKRQSIADYNKLKGRITDKIKHSGSVDAEVTHKFGEEEKKGLAKLAKAIVKSKSK